MTVLKGTAGRYRRLLGQPVLRGLAAADVCARLPQGMVSICLLLVVAWHASMAAAGLAVAACTLGQAVTGPARGRLADELCTIVPPCSPALGRTDQHVSRPQQPCITCCAPSPMTPDLLLRLGSLGFPAFE